MAVVSPSFISFFSYNMAHGASEAPYSNQRYTLAEKGKADFVYKGRRWPSPFPPWKKLYRQPAGFIMQHLWTTREGKIPLKRKRKGVEVRCGGGAGGTPTRSSWFVQFRWNEPDCCWGAGRTLGVVQSNRKGKATEFKTNRTFL